MGFPLMLIALCVTSVAVAIQVCLLGSLILFAISYLRGIKQESWIGLTSYLLQISMFAVLASLTPPLESPTLAYQVLWMLSFLLVHVLGLLLIRHNRFPKLQRPTCCCDKRRNETLFAEYVRFDRIVLRFCLFFIALYLPFIYLLDPSPRVELLLSFVLAIVASAAIILESVHLSWLKKHLRSENWLPIMNQHQEVIGRIAQSELDQEVEGYLPIVRLLAISQGMIYLEQVKSCLSKKQEQYDTPFTDWLIEGDDPMQIAQRMIDARFCGIRRVKPRQLLPYHIEIGGRKLLVYLMVVTIDEPSQLYIDCRPIEGKWWSLDLLKDSLASGTSISSNIESEIPLVEQIVLLAHRLTQQSKHID